MKFKVIHIETNKDVTNNKQWCITSDGTFGYYAPLISINNMVEWTFKPADTMKYKITFIYDDVTKNKDEFTEDELQLLYMAFVLVYNVITLQRTDNYDVSMCNALFNLKEKLGIYDLLENYRKEKGHDGIILL